MISVDDLGYATVADASVTGTSNIIVSQGRHEPTDENDPSMDSVTWAVSSVDVGSFVVFGVSDTPIRGEFRITYMVG